MATVSVVLERGGRGIKEVRLRPGADGLQADVFFALSQLSAPLAAVDRTLRDMEIMRSENARRTERVQ